MAPRKKYEIQVANHPLQARLTSLLESLEPNPDFSFFVPIVFGLLLTVGLALFAASFIVFPVEEKLCQVRPNSYSDPKITNIPNEEAVLNDGKRADGTLVSWSKRDVCPFVQTHYYPL
jgi:hypothetical protein